MAAGKLMKMRTAALKKINSLGKLRRTSSNNSISSSVPSFDDHRRQHDDHRNAPRSEQHAVYVGRSRRRYSIRSEVLDHPVLQELARKSEGSDEINVDCEVVLFEHLLWMLDNNRSEMDQSLDELLPFYSY